MEREELVEIGIEGVGDGGIRDDDIVDRGGGRSGTGGGAVEFV